MVMWGYDVVQYLINTSPLIIVGTELEHESETIEFPWQCGQESKQRLKDGLTH